MPGGALGRIYSGRHLNTPLSKHNTAWLRSEGLRRGGHLPSPAIALPVRVPVVHAVEPSRIGTIGPREVLHRVDVVEVMVVLEDRVAHVDRRAVVREVAGRGEDGVVRVVDAPALPVLGPRAGEELHRTLGAGR